MGAVLLPVLLLARLSAVAAASGAVQGQLQRLLGESVARTMWGKVLGVATGVGLRYFESPDFYNRLNRVQTSAMLRPHQVTQGLLSMGSALGVPALGLGITLFAISPVLLPLVVVAGVPLLITSGRESRLEFDFSVAQTPAVRLRGYFTLLQTGRDEAKEVRAFGLAGWLATRFDGAVRRLPARPPGPRRAAAALLSLVGQLGSAIVLGGTLIALVALIDRGEIGVAEAGAAIVAIRLLATQVQALFRGAQSIFESGLFLDDLQPVPRPRRGGGRRGPADARPRSGSTWCGSRTSGSATPARTGDALNGRRRRAARGRGRRPGRRERLGQDHPGQAARRPLPARRGTRALGRAGRGRVPALQPAPAHRRRLPGLRPLRAAGHRQHRARSGRPRRRARRGCASAAAAAGADDDARRAPARLRHRAVPACSPAAPTCRAASGSASRWRAPSTATPRCVILDEPSAGARPARGARAVRHAPGRAARPHGAVHLPPLLHRARRRPHLRAARGRDRRAGHPRRAGGAATAATPSCSGCRPSCRSTASRPSSRSSPGPDTQLRG